MEDLGRTNQWAAEWFCPRKDCLPCQGRAFLAKEEEEEALRLVANGEDPGNVQNKAKKAKQDSRKSLPSCTSEGSNYILECISCRGQDKRRVYLGETSRSCYQRGKEHSKEIREGIATHPMVVHAAEEHEGEVQPVLMRILSSHLTPMDRQIQESLNIIEESRIPGNCMNLKSEWAGAKIPVLAMHLPKGLARDKTLIKGKDSGGAMDQEAG